jgi:predicted secreted hydrolase
VSKRKWVVATVLVVVLAVTGAWLVLQPGDRRLGSSVAASVPADATGFARAMEPRLLVFPADAGSHDDYQTEWWYYTGNLTAPTGEHFGYQLTFFRRALAPPDRLTPRASDWGMDQAYLAHLAVTDVAGGRHFNFERLERGAAGLASAQAVPYRVWLDDWSVSQGADGLVSLRAADGSIGLKLDMRDLTPPVLQGDGGYSRKGPEPGNASYYYSLPRLDTQGEITVRGQTYPVKGLSWMDHEWSTSALSAGQVGWDWFSLQLSDGRALMLYQMRRADGSRDPFSAGTLVEADGTTRRLTPGDFQIQATGQWRSPHTGAVYPAGWKLSAPSAGLELTVTPYLADQEMTGTYNYWEGAAHAQGSADGRSITANGYVELTGYAGSMAGQF